MPTLGISSLWSPERNDLLQRLSATSIRAVEFGFNSEVPRTLPDEVVNLAKRLNIRLSIHLPFFVSWADPSKSAQSARYLCDGAILASTLGSIAAFHLGHYGNKKFEAVRQLVVEGIRSAIDSAKSAVSSRHFVLGAETSGKVTEIGSIEEVLSVAREFARTEVVPIVDWSHLYARSNGQFPRSEKDYRSLIDKLEFELELKEFYFHASGIEFKDFQEKRHLSVKTCTPPLPHLLKVLNEIGCEYTLIVESPDPIPDVLWLEEIRRNPERWLEFAETQLRKAGLQQTLT
jgi:endonuclease IV